MAEVQFETTSGAQAKVDAGLAGVIAVSATRKGLVEQARNVIAETCALENALQGASTSSTPASGELIGGLVGLLAGDPCKGVAFNLTKNAVTFTLFKVGIFDLAGNLLASSADQSAAFNAGGNGKKEVPFSGLYTETSNAARRVAVLATVSAGTYSLNRSGTSSLYSSAIDGGAPLIANQTGLADLPATAVFVAGNGASALYWLAVYK